MSKKVSLRVRVGITWIVRFVRYLVGLILPLECHGEGEVGSEWVRNVVEGEEEDGEDVDVQARVLGQRPLVD